MYRNDISFKNMTVDRFQHESHKDKNTCSDLDWILDGLKACNSMELWTA